MDPTTKKTIAFLILDIIMMFIFAWFWFKFVHPKTGPVDPSSESFKYTVCMTTFFGIYYYIFERMWNSGMERVI